MKLRPLSLHDLDAITELDQLCFSPGIAFSRDVFEDCLQARCCQTFGVEEDDRLAAFAVLYYDGPRSAQIFTLDVHPAYRRRGLADLLMAAIEKAACEKGVRRLTLQVATDNESALALYQKWGFSLRVRLRDYYGRGKDGWLMERILSDNGKSR